MFANSDGTDAPNTAAAAGAVAAVAGLQIAGTKDPSGCDNDPGPREIIQEVAPAVADEGFKSIDIDITPAQAAHHEEHGWRIWRDRGHIVHNRTAGILDDRYPGRFVYNKNKGPDFFDSVTNKWSELTTPGAVSKHKRKGWDKTVEGYDPRYKTCDYSTYNWKHD